MKNKGRKIFLIVIAILSAVVAIAVLGQIVRERKRGYSSDRTIPLLLGYEEGAYYINEDGVPVRTEDDEWNEYLVDAGSQFYEISEVSVTFSSQYRHQVLWLDKELQVLREQEVRGGEHVFPIMDKAEYLLIPAQKDEIFSVNGRLTAAGAEEKGQKEKDAEAFSGKYLSVLGDSLSACSFYIPGNYYPHYPKGDVDIRQMWWYLLADSLDMNVCKINACASSGVTRLTWDGLTGDEAGSAGRGTDLDMLGHIPDVILVWIGGNDMAAGADKSQVAEDYRKMLEKARILMLPYIIFSAIAWIVTWMGFQFPFGTALLEGAGYSMKSPAGFLFSLLTYICPVDNHLWFSYVLFLVFLLAFGLMGKPKKIVLPAAYAGYALSFLIPLPELIQKLMRYFFLFQAGTVLYRKERWLDNRRARLIVGPAFAVGFLFFCIFHALNWGEPQILSEPVAEIAGCSLILYIMARLKKGKGMKLLKETGRMSYQIYLLHHPFVVPGLLILLKGRMPVALLLPTVTVLGILIPVAVYRWVFERWSSLNIVCFGGRSRDQ